MASLLHRIKMVCEHDCIEDFDTVLLQIQEGFQALAESADRADKALKTKSIPADRQNHKRKRSMLRQ